MGNFTVTHNKTRTEIEQRGLREDVSVEFVTDTILQLVVTIDTRERRVMNGPWSLVAAIQDAAFMIEDDTDCPAASFLLTFTAAWTMTQAQKMTTRRKAHHSRRA